MSGAEDTLPSPAARDAAGIAPPAAAPRGRLFRKYALLFVALVGAALLINSGFDFWFSYQENKAGLIRIQQEKAAAAATRIEEAIGEYERQIGWTTHAQWAAGPLDQRRQDYFRLLRQVPAITELTQLDSRGRECLTVSRVKMDVVPVPECEGADFSQNPAFTEAKAHRKWFSPVYFRKESEPYMTLAMARDGKNAGVTIAEINLKLIWDVITALKIGQGGYAYVVDGRGKLIAHPDISLVLRDTDLAKLPQVAAALSSRGTAAGAASVSMAENLAGRRVLTAHAAIEPLGWQVFVEVPLTEAFAPLYGAAMRTVILLAAGLVAAALVALFLARRMTGPIRQLQEGAERIGAGDLNRRIAVHTGDELEALAGQFNRMAGDLQKSYAELEQRVRDRTAELSEALDQQTATSDILRAIAAAPSEAEGTLRKIAETTSRLFDASGVTIRIADGNEYAVTIHVGRGAEDLTAALSTATARQPVLARSLPGAVLRENRQIHLPDLDNLDPEVADWPGTRVLRAGGARSLVGTPLRREGRAFGSLNVWRDELQPFNPGELQLLQSFADQAAIAIENARLITETREALEQQTATAEVLGVINASPGDLGPVFEAILDKAMHLCESACGQLNIYDGEIFNLAAFRGPQAITEFMRNRRGRAGSGTSMDRLVRGEFLVHIVDALDDDGYRLGDPDRRALVELGGFRSLVSVGLRKEQTLLGAITIYRQEVRPFSDKQIALLQNFAAQAVIAMENARLITETREALDQQTATAEVLGVINSSPGDLAPVFDAMLERATRLCEADCGQFATFDGEFFRFVAAHGDTEVVGQLLASGPIAPSEGLTWPSQFRGANVVHIADIKAAEAYRLGNEAARAFWDAAGARTLLSVSLRREEVLLGTITVYRRALRPFSDKQIALLQNFAAQAVIAMENARLITETREALEQQTATAEVLGVINASPGDLVPVFDAMLEKAMRLCEARQAHLFTFDGELVHPVAVRGNQQFGEWLRQQGPTRSPPGSSVDRLRLGEPFVHMLDPTKEEPYRTNPWFRELIDRAGCRTTISVPLRKDNVLLGTIHLYRDEVRPFTDKQIALLQNFATQAVIAMENARLITETREALQQQTATAEVLEVINSSPGNLAPVFDAMLEKATTLCEAAFGIMRTWDGERFQLAAVHGNARFGEYARRIGEIRPNRDGSPLDRIVNGEPFVFLVDALAEEAYRTSAGYRAMVDASGIRSAVTVALRKDTALLGAVTVYRQEVRPFTDKQIALLQNFAAQAVIAIENARLLGELRSRTDELAQSVEELKALSEVAQAVSSTLDLRGVLVAILNRSVDLSGADAGAIFRYSRADRSFRFVEAVGYSEVMAQDVRRLDVVEDVVPGLSQAIAGRAPLQIPDLRERPSNPLRDQAIAAGYRSVLIVPLIGADRVLGATILQRRAVGEFPEATVRLMQTLASQSVLAIQNARLFREIADKSEQLAEASRHKSQFLANMSHELRTPLNAILGYAELMADGIYGELAPRAAGVLERVQNNGKHLLALINDVLDLSKIEAGQLTLALEDYALPDVVQSVVSATESLASSKGLSFTADVAPGLPVGRGDSRRLAQVLLNLTGNAIKFTDAGEVAIGAAAEGGNFVITVRDTGPGISPENHDKIFGEFQQVDNSNTRQKGGTGLGLAISKRMVEMQGGSITVDSELGHGATFRVTLPIRVEDMPEELLGAAQ